MSYKKLLGLEMYPISEEEICRRILDAEKKHIHMLKFHVGKKDIKIHLSDVHPEGIMKGYDGYYS
jgi:hypothetical protein